MSEDPNKELDLSKMVIRISAYILLLLGFAVLGVEYFFYFNNKGSMATSIVIGTTAVFLFILVIFIVLNRKYKILNTDNKEKEDEE